MKFLKVPSVKAVLSAYRNKIETFTGCEMVEEKRGEDEGDWVRGCDIPWRVFMKQWELAWSCMEDALPSLQQSSIRL